MSVYHCPLCPLIFEHRTEVEWHLREEHRSRADEELDLRAELGSAAIRLDWDRLQELRASSHTPSVSVLFATTPASSMTVLDVARLRHLADRARRRLNSEPERGSAAPVVEHRLSRAVAEAEGSATDRGMAILVNEHELAIISLPFEPRDRAAVDRGFATRDLEYALRRYPMYRVLVLGHHPRVLEGRGRDLVEVDTDAAVKRPWAALFAGAGSDRDEADHLIDQAVRSSGLLPLVVVGDRRRLAAFRARSRHAESVRAEALQPRARATAVDRLAEEAYTRWHREQQDRAVGDLAEADASERITWGLSAAWRAVAARTARRIWVEHDFARPGRARPGVAGVETVTDSAEPGVIDDLVDTLIARASRQDISVELLDPGTLGRDEPIATEVAPLATNASPDESAPNGSELRACEMGSAG
jgi:hypothetical protein